MPEIKRYQGGQVEERTGAPVRQNPAAFSGVATEAERNLGAITEIQVLSEERMNRIQQQREIADTQEVVNNYNRELIQFHTEEKNKTFQDASGARLRAQKKGQDFINEKSTQVPPWLKQKFRQRITDMTLQVENDLAGHEAIEVRKYYGKVIDNAVEGAKSNAFLDPYNAGNYAQGAIDGITDMVSAGMIGSDMGKMAVQETNKQIYSAALDGMIHQAPGEAVKAIKQGRFNEFLDSATLDEFAGKAEQAERALRIEEERLKKAEEDALKKKREEVGTKFIEAFSKGELSTADVLAAKDILHPTEGENSIRAWLKRIEDETKKPMEKSDPAAYEAISRRIDTDDTITVEDVYGYKGLSAKDKEHFSGKIIAKGRRPNDMTAKVKRAKKILSDMKTKKVFDDGDPAQNLTIWAALDRELDEYVKNNPEGDPEQYVNDSTTEYTTSKISRFLNYIGSKLGIGDAATPKSETNIPEGAKPTGKTINGKPAYQLPDGRYWTE